MAVSEEFIHICKQYKASSFYVVKLPEKVRRNVRKVFPIPLTDDIIAFLDSSMLNNGKSGVALCTSGIYYKWIHEKSMITWDKLDQLNFTAKGNYASIIFENGFEIKISGSNYSAEQFANLLEELKQCLSDVTDKRVYLPMNKEPKKITMVRTDELLPICEKFQNSRKKAYLYPDIPRKVHFQALKNYHLKADDEIIFVIDTTLLGTGRQGIAICQSGLYWKNDLTVPTIETHLSWSDFMQEEITYHRKYQIVIGDGNIISMAGARMKRETTIKLLKEIQYYLQAKHTEKLIKKM